MIDQNQTPNPNQVPTPVPVATPPQTTPKTSLNWKLLIERVKLISIRIFNRFYSNKKIFWPVTIAFGLIFLIVVIGLIFGRRGMNQSSVKVPTPSPIVESTPQATSSGDILLDSQNKLNDLKKQINNLDVKESRLSPPAINFNIKF